MRIEVTYYDILIFFYLICLLKYKLVCSSQFFSVGFSRVSAYHTLKLLTNQLVLGGYLLRHVGIRGVFDQNLQTGVLHFPPAVTLQMEWDFGQKFREEIPKAEGEITIKKAGKARTGKMTKKEMKELASKNQKLSWGTGKTTKSSSPDPNLK